MCCSRSSSSFLLRLLPFRSAVALVAVSVVVGLSLPVFAAPVIHEILYRPGTGYPENTRLEFIEIHNPDATAVDVSGWGITTGADFTFPAGTTIPAGGFLVVSSDPAALRAATGLATVFGPWNSGSTLSNRGEDLTLSKPGATAGTWETVDRVTYADEGDWAVRTRDSLGGWSWVTGANGSGRSMERINPRVARDSGQGWAVSATAGGTPGAANSAAAANLAPVITGVRHSPAVPKSSDPVTISCDLTDESGAPSLSATLHWRNATTTTPGAFQTVAMTGNGTGRFTATLGALADRTIVEFYVSATDGTLTRTWPAPTSEGQNANCTYQVDNEVVAGSAPVYRFVLTAAENAAFNTLAQSNPRSDRFFAFTLVVTQGASTTIRYRASMRIRGNSSRMYSIKPLRISLPTDDRWDEISDFTIGPRGAPWQYLAHKIQRAAGLVAADVSPVELRRQGLEQAVTTGSTADYGRLVRVEEIDGDYVDNHWPDAVAGQIYRKTAVSSWNSNGAAPADPEGIWSGWSKQNNSGANDWSDVMNFSRVWQTTAAPHFTGATAGNVASGTWRGTGFTDAEIQTLSTVVDLDYMARWLALMTILPNNEPNLSTGEDDDYAAAFIDMGSGPRMILLPHDMDTTFGTGEQTFSATSVGLYDATEVDTIQRAGAGQVTQMEPLLPLLGNSTTPGNAVFRTKYLTAIRELFGSVFDADTTGNANPPFYQYVDNHLADWVPAANRATIKAFMTARQSYLLGLIGSGKIAPAAPTASGVLAAVSTPAVRISEVLASNTRTLLNGATYPDVIELHNAGAAAVDLSGRSLSDDPATPAKYVFPAGTSIPAGGYLVVFADSVTSAPGLHTGFGLDAEGDGVYLFDTAASGGALLDRVTFGLQVADHSIARPASAPGGWALCLPTVGAANGEALTLGAPGSIRINEWVGNSEVRVEEDFIELYNPSASPVALGGVRVTDNLVARPERYVFPDLSFIAAGGFKVIDSDFFDIGFNGNFDTLFLVGQNGALIDVVDFGGQPEDVSTGRATDGGVAWADFAVPTPGLPNGTVLPAAYAPLLSGLRITEVMYRPVAASSAGDYEFVELLNIGASTLDLSGVRFVNGIDYTFASGTTLAPGAYLVVAKSRSAFLSRYPGAASALAAGVFSGALDNSGETVSLALPAPWAVNILRFKYETTWSTLANTSGYSLVMSAPVSTPAREWGDGFYWTGSAGVNGSPGSAGLIAVTGGASAGGVAGAATTLVASSVSGATAYQWQVLVGGTWVDLAGATASTYTLPSTQLVHNGSYRVVVTLNGVATASDTVGVTVASPTTPSAARVLNLSTRGQALTGAQVLIPGFVIGGTTGTKKMLLRVVGPTLAGFNVAGTLVDPLLQLKRLDPTTGAYVDVAANDTWGSAANLAALTSATTAVGAFPLTAQSADAALLVDLAPGSYTALASGVNAGTGVALVELYDADGAQPATRLVNLASRGYVGTGANVLIAGFVVSSEGSRTLLVRAVGPTLQNFGVAGVLADPLLQVFGRPGGATTDQLLVSSDNWSAEAGATVTATAATQAGAFALPSGSKDAALVITLPPGAYTVHASGVGSTEGVALLEVYALP